MKVVRGNREHGNLENTFRTIRGVTSEDSDHLPMQRQLDFAICSNKQHVNSSSWRDYHLWLNTYEGFTCVL